MKDYAKEARIFDTQILVIGGGISGLSAAVSAKEAHPEADVLLADKACASRGFAGKAGRTTGLISYVTEEDDPEDFVKHCVEHIGFYLNDQDLLREMAENSRRIVEKVSDEWGVNLVRDDDGKIVYAKWPTPWGTAGIDPDMCIAISAKAKQLGVRFLDHTAFVKLTLKDGRVRGAIGFEIDTGRPVAVNADAVIMAAGDQNYLITTGWCATGNGIYMAYEAGAKMRNVEFCSMCDFARKDPDGIIYYGGHGGAHIAHDHLHTANENISQKYRPGFHSSIDPEAINAWYQETVKGNGPVFVDLSDFAQNEGVLFRWHPNATKRRAIMHTKTNIGDGKNFEVVPGFLGEVSSVRVDHDMKTTVPGLFAAGDTCGSGSARGGAAPTPPGKIHGTGILNAFFTGMKAGKNAADEVCGKEYVKAGITDLEIDEALGEIFAPMESEGCYDIHSALADIQDIVAPVDYSMVRSEERMKKALEETLAYKEKLKELKAEDYREALRCFDLKCMALCSEMFYRASLERKETRGFCFREDYPDMDNKEWLKWIIVEKDGEGMKISTEDIPIEDYRYRPEGM